MKYESNEVINFEFRERNKCGYSGEFEFFESRIDQLNMIVSNLSKYENPEKRKTVKFGSNIKGITIQKLLEFLEISN